MSHKQYKTGFFPYNFEFSLTGNFIHLHYYPCYMMISVVYHLIYCFHLPHIFFFLFCSCSVLRNLILNLYIHIMCVANINILTRTLESVRSNANSITVLFLNNIWKLENLKFDHIFPYSVTAIYNLISSYFQLPLNWFLFFKKNPFL